MSAAGDDCFFFPQTPQRGFTGRILKKCVCIVYILRTEWNSGFDEER